MFGDSSKLFRILAIGVGAGVVAAVAIAFLTGDPESASTKKQVALPVTYQPRQPLEMSGFLNVFASIKRWPSDASLDDYAAAYENAIPRGLSSMDAYLTQGFNPLAFLQKAALFQARGDTDSAYKTLEEFESIIKGSAIEGEWLYTIIHFKGMSALRKAENDNCVMCRGGGACILPISGSAVHKKPAGSRLAVKHFTEYLSQFPDDLEVKWLLNVAHMTLGEHPHQVDPRYLLPMDVFAKSEFDIGQFEDVAHLLDVNRLNQSGGAIIEDFDNDGLLDLAVSSWAPSEPMAFYRNKGDGTFEDRTKAAGLEKQRGGLMCVQTDYNNDGHMDIFVPRGSWMPADLCQRPSLLRNNGDGTFTDVTEAAGLSAPVNSVSASWADFDNDGFVDLFICGQRKPCILYRNKGDGTFEDFTARAGLENIDSCLGSAWIDIDNNGVPDLFLNRSDGVAGKPGAGKAKLFRNDGKGVFTEVTKEMGIDGPESGFSCWAFDFDNDGWLDIFATTSSHTLEEVVQGMFHLPCKQTSKARLYRNLEGKGFKDIAKEAGLDKVYSPMGSNFGDLDNDGFLDFYLGTGDPNLSTLIPNRMFKNVGGKRFSEITTSTRTGHLQKGHAVAFADWDRNGSQDVFIQLGGAVAGDQYHNAMFQNPGQGNHWLSVKLVGKKTNRAAIGARITVVTAGDSPLTVCRHVSSGSSFGANPLEQHFGLGKAKRVAKVEVYWPTSRTTQVFRDISVDRGLVITEFSDTPQSRTWSPIALPK
ncbi:MAG: CRTAC1 family protein [Gemmataceae bacterium]